MANLLNNLKERKNTKPGNLETQYKSSISNILLVVVFSAVNIVLLLVNSNSYFLFSAFVPYFTVDYGMYFCGMYPEEYYYDVPDMIFEERSVLGIWISIAVVILLVYILCWYLASKKKLGALIAALVFFIIDTAAMLWVAEISMDSIIDILMHVWVLSYLVFAIVIYFKIKKSPAQEITDESSDNGTPD